MVSKKKNLNIMCVIGDVCLCVCVCARVYEEGWGGGVVICEQCIVLECQMREHVFYQSRLVHVMKIS